MAEIKTNNKRTEKLIRKNKYLRSLAKSRRVSSMNKGRLGIFFVVVVLLFTALILRCAYWQIIHADELHIKAAEMQKEDVKIDPVRGTIYDSNMKPLAQTVTEYDMYAYTQILYKDTSLTEKEREKSVKNLAEVTGVKKSKIKKLLGSDEGLVEIATGLKQEQVQKAEELFGDSIVVKTKIDRSYPNGNFASHVIGFVDDENSGRYGLEYQYNSVLAGVKGRSVRTTDSQGNTLANGGSRYYQAEDGYNIVTTIDEVIQHYVEEAVSSGMKKTRADQITVIVSDPKTGDILAMANSPGYNPNDPYEPISKADREKFDSLSYENQSAYLSNMWTNPAISEIYEPGSTFKLVTSSSALDSGAATLNSMYNCPGYINIDGTTIKCWGAAHGSENLTESVGNSCNPALATVALNMGAETFYKYIDLYGFDDTTDIDLPGEGVSIVKDTEGMSRVDLGTTGFGHGIAITPIQMLMAINSMGNDGVLMKPKLVKEIIDNDGNVIKSYDDVAVRQVISKDVADKMRDIMEYYVAKGGGGTAYIPGYRIGGKTGTAYIASNGGYSKDTVASFIAMAPMDDPVVSVLVMVTKPRSTEFGSTAAGPVLKEIMEKTLSYKGVEKVFTNGEEEQSSNKEVTVPDVTNMNSKDAIKAIKAAGLKYKKMPEGTKGNFLVVDQYPKAKEKVSKGDRVYIYSE